MKMKFVKGCLAVLAAGLLTSGAAVAQSERAATLDELLRMIEESRVQESQEHRDRERRFRQERENQDNLLSEARDTQASEEARSERLEETYSENETAIQNRRRQLQERMGGLREMFGHLTSTAGDLRTLTRNSLVSAQLPDRGEFLNDLIDTMNSQTRLPSMADIERLWFELQREMVESGRVVKFEGIVIKPDGDRETQDIVRIGNYNLVSEGRYLSFNPAGNKIEELPRQPSRGILSGAANLQNASEGLVQVGIDPTGPRGGSYLSAIINTPSLEERWHQGGVVGYIITAVGIFGILLGIWRVIVLSSVGAKVSKQLKTKEANENNPLGRVLKVAEDNKGVDPETLELKLEEAVLKERPAIESGLAVIKIIAAVAPLLGLLGTVTGMIQTFQAITIFGAGDPTAMAGGISSALVTTVMGLIVAIPTVLMHTIVNGRAKRVIHVIEEQTAGIIAENAENK
ncbi:MotA/TolQ/ExbB proton channel family protein [Marinimicrobium alkaliphilum]|uniref:MotA/TolQ/ExbB proton channel family protein n=1 Tax=Marinimicrobium alkaliphilum TaxID=2202654 RepID=UPI000DBA7B79|nr:MotA/TolQ/ExbB proton channel family protein [Marinimicrobium alkaliphilum]